MPVRPYFHPEYMRGLFHKEKAQVGHRMSDEYLCLSPSNILENQFLCSPFPNTFSIFLSWIFDPDFGQHSIIESFPFNVLSYEISGNGGTYREQVKRNRETSQVSLPWETLMHSREAGVRASECMLDSEETNVDQQRGKHSRKPEKTGHHSRVWSVFGG